MKIFKMGLVLSTGLILGINAFSQMSDFPSEDLESSSIFNFEPLEENAYAPPPNTPRPAPSPVGPGPQPTPGPSDPSSNPDPLGQEETLGEDSCEQYGKVRIGGVDSNAEDLTWLSGKVGTCVEENWPTERPSQNAVGFRFFPKVEEGQEVSASFTFRLNGEVITLETTYPQVGMGDRHIVLTLP